MTPERQAKRERQRQARDERKSQSVTPEAMRLSRRKWRERYIRLLAESAMAKKESRLPPQVRYLNGNPGKDPGFRTGAGYDGS